MARGRMISKSFSTSAKRDALMVACPKMAEFCEFLFVMLVTHADDQGRLPGDELTVKLQIDPVSRRKLPDFVAALHLLHQVGLILWYQVEGKKLIQIVKFAEHQDLKGHNLRPGKLPECPGIEAFIGGKRDVGEVGESSPKPPLSKENVSEGKLSEVNLTQPGEEERFGVFWQAYPKKVGKDAARKAFEKRTVGDDLLARMLGAIEQQKHSREWVKDDGQFIPHPATWLNAGRWEDEPVQPAVVSIAGSSTKAAADLVKAALRKQA